MTAVVIVTCDECKDSAEIPVESLLLNLSGEMPSFYPNIGWEDLGYNIHLCPECKHKRSEIILVARYSQEKVDLAKYRFWVIKSLLEIEKGSERRVAVTQRAEEVEMMLVAGTVPIQKMGYSASLSVSVTTIYRWLASYSENNSLESLISLTHKRGGKDESRLEDEAEQIMQRVIEANVVGHKKYKIDDMWEELAHQVEAHNQEADPVNWVAVPSRATLSRRIKTFKQSSSETN